MEELTSILGIVVAAGMLLAKLWTREKASGANGKANPEGEAWPAGQQPATAPRQIRQEAEAMLPHEASGSDPTTAPRENGRESYREDRQPGKKPSAAARTPERQLSGAPAEAHRQHPHVPAEEFDLQRAIVYSEILKPKFDE